MHPWGEGAGPPPLFGPRCRLFNIGPKIGAPPGPPFFACRPSYNGPPPRIKNPGSAPATPIGWVVSLLRGRHVPPPPPIGGCSGVPRGGGHGRAQALEGAPGQLVGANFNLAKVAYTCYGPRSLCIRGSFFSLSCRRPFFFFFFSLVDFIPQEEMLIMGGGRCKHWPPGTGDPRYATGWVFHT